MMKAWLRCEISDGQFSSERAVSFKNHSGVTRSLFMDVGWLNLDRSEVKVEILDECNGLSCVQFSSIILEGSYSEIVPSDQLRNDAVTVYAVSSGDYSDYGIDAVFLSRDVAERFKAAYENNNPGESVRVEDWKVETDFPVDDDRLKAWTERNLRP